jgi:predicted ATPase
MINKVKIENFKCFQKETTFDFSKLNILTGINGRGKSSLLQSILMISQSFNITNNFTEKLALNGRLISLGNFDDIKNSETPRGQHIKLEFEIDNSISASFQINESENDEMCALIQSSYIDFVDVFELDKFEAETQRYIENLLKEYGETYQKELKPFLKHLVFSFIISKIHYICADRLGPVKYVDKASFDTSQFISVGTRGEKSINVLAKSDLPLVDDKLYLGNDSKSVIQQTEEWLNYILDGAKIEIKGKEQSSSVLWMLINNKPNSYKYKPQNVGFGYSYILPLIITGLIAKPGEVLIIENPEAHLHPRAQSKIAEFFALVASCGVQVFIESHSEHILNGLRVSVLNQAINLKNSELIIHYFNESFTSEKLIMDEKGKIENWPNGFFDQQELDLAEIFKYSRNS